LFLDTFPCNAHTTASDALWAGLPVVTCLGRTFAGRVAASLLHAVGLPELVARDLGGYETWKSAKGGVFTTTVSEAMSFVRQAVERQK